MKEVVSGKLRPISDLWIVVSTPQDEFGIEMDGGGFKLKAEGRSKPF